MHVRTPILVFIPVLCAFGLSSVARGDESPKAEGVAYFEKHIRPLLAKRCYACHSTRAKKREGGLLLDSRKGWESGGDSGAAIVPTDAEASLLIQAVRRTNPDLQMPPDNRLSKTEVARLEHWVKLGAPDPRDGAAEAIDLTDPSDPIAGREHWAFRPLAEADATFRRAAIGRSRSLIDAFVLGQLEIANLTAAPEADRRTLVRRVYFQLLGLPPTPEQVADFLDDDRPDAYERLVDQLLASPHFGERWGRHWLDLARYADSNGLDENFLFREAWRYRNWVIAAVNDDIAYDQFLTEQIAGDLLTYDSIAQRDRQRIGAGFLVVGPKVLLGNDAEERRMDVADEQLDTIGRAALGQTLGCARCHDHKFDPIPTTDYYALAGIMTSTEVMETRHMLGQQRLMERLVGIGPDGQASDDSYEKYWREHKQRKETAKQAKSALDLLKKNDVPAVASLAQEHPKAVAKVALDSGQTSEQRTAAQEALVAKLIAAATAPTVPPRAMIPADRKTPANESIRISGQFDRFGEEVPRGFLQVLSSTPTEISPGSSGRLEFATWLTDGEHGAGHLAARVMANRVWYHMIGRGIVRTVDNFGRTGEAPTHPRLLDYLASELIASEWSVKELVRQIAVSSTFRRSSQHDADAHRVDPDNRLLWRAHRRRLEPEALRDAMLQVAGELDLAPMNSSVWYLGDQATAVGANTNRRRTDFPCRSAYLPVIRNDLPELFDAFDFADPHSTTGMRPQTLVATQGLFLLNDESVMAAAEATARRVLLVDDDRVARMFDLVLTEPPTQDERDQFQAFVAVMHDQLTKQGDKDAELRAWAMACHALLASSRFQILE